MAPKKKKQPKNAFYYFLMEFKEEAEKNGRNTNSSEIDAEADLAWRNLDSERRLHYENVAAERRKKVDNLENKFTTTGVSYAQLQREQMERNRQKEIMINEIESTVRSLTASTLKTKMFYFIHVNYYCRLLDGHFLPCEIGIAKFTFQDGVKDCYHTIVNLECIPTGYFLECQKNSEETHQIPLPPENSFGEQDNEKILVQIKAFLTENGNYPPVYTLQTNIEAAQDTLTTFAAGEDLFRVYPISKLLFELRNACAAQVQGVGFPVESLAEREFEKDFFNLSPGISCDYHEGMDACQYCSLSIVKRWGFLFASLGCVDLGITLRDGSHRPRKVTLPPAPPEPMVSKTQVSLRKGKKGTTVAEPPPITIIDYSTKSIPEQIDISSSNDVESPLAQFGTYIRANVVDNHTSETTSQSCAAKHSNNHSDQETDQGDSPSDIKHINHSILPLRKKQEITGAISSHIFNSSRTSNEKIKSKMTFPSVADESVCNFSKMEPLLHLPIRKEKQLDHVSVDSASKTRMPSKTISQNMHYLHSDFKNYSTPANDSSKIPLRNISVDSKPIEEYFLSETPQQSCLSSMNDFDYLSSDDILQYQYSKYVNDFRNGMSPCFIQPPDNFDLYIDTAFQPITRADDHKNGESFNSDNVSPIVSTLSKKHVISMAPPRLSLRPPYCMDIGIGHGRGITLENNVFSSQPGRENVSSQQGLLRQPWVPQNQQIFRNGDILASRLTGRGRGRARVLFSNEREILK